ncbi:hypothetical protein [Longispora albida]|nr:hypothetical protein [Longispora albida]
MTRQVFADHSGRRRRLAARAGTGLALALLAWLGLVAVNVASALAAAR